MIIIDNRADNLKNTNTDKMNFDQLMCIIENDKDGNAFYILDEKAILKNIFPFTEELKTIGRCKYHVEDAFTHMNMVYKVFKQVQYGKIVIQNFNQGTFCRKIQNYNLWDILALAGFTHDIGKYKSYKNEDGKVSFINHEIIGEYIVSDVLQKLKAPKAVEQVVCSIVKAHMYPLKLFKVQNDKNQYEEFLKEFVDNYSEYIMYILILSFCDIWATSLYYDPENEAECYKKFIEELLIKVKRCRNI